MPETTRTHRKTEGTSAFIPNLIDRVFGTVESFVERLMGIISESADQVVSRGIQKLFGLLLVIVGIAFILSGLSQIIDQLFQSVGVGQIVVGALLLTLTAIVMLVVRKR